MATTPKQVNSPSAILQELLALGVIRVGQDGVTLLYPDGAEVAGGGGGSGTVTSVGALTLGTTGTDANSSVANPTTTPVITLNLPSASAANRGLLTAADWTAFNAKQAALGAGSVSNAMLANAAVANLSGTNTGDQTNITGNTATVTTNANMTGPITSVGNATALASQTGTGSQIVVATSPTITALSLTAGTAATGTAPLKLATGPLLTTPEAGAVEMLTSNLYFTPVAGAGTREQLNALSETVGYRGTLRVGFAGDSIGGMWSASDGLSPLWWAATELYPCDFSVFMNTSVGGTSSTSLLSLQIGQLEALTVKPHLVIVQSLQNDFLADAASAAAFVANLTTYATRALAAGVKMVCLCSRPPKSSGSDPATAVVYANRLLEDFSRDTPGCYYVDVFSVWRFMNSAGETTTIPWKGTASTANAYSDDGTHPTGLAARAAAPLILPILQRFAKPILPMPQAGVAYDNTNYPWSNVLGRNGMMLGTNGQLNAVNNAGVAGFSTGAQDRWFLVDGNGITATPTIVTGADGYLYQEIALAGTASAAATITLTTNYIQTVAVGDFVAEAIVETASLTGVRDISFASNGFTAVNLNSLNDAVQFSFPSQRFHFRTPKSVGFSNSGFVNKATIITVKVANGATVSGSLRVGRVGVYRIG